MFKQLLIVLALTVTPLQARTWADAGGWEVAESTDRDGCYMASEFQGPGDTTLILTHQLNGRILLGVSNTNWSISKDDKFADLRYVLDKVAYSGGEAVAVIHNDGSKGFVTLLNADFLTDFAASKSLDIKRGDVVVDELLLNGSAAGLAQMGKCMAHLKAVEAAAAREKARWKHIPKDPFAKTPATAD